MSIHSSATAPSNRAPTEGPSVSVCEPQPFPRARLYLQGPSDHHQCRRHEPGGHYTTHLGHPTLLPPHVPHIDQREGPRCRRLRTLYPIPPLLARCPPIHLETDGG